MSSMDSCTPLRGYSRISAQALLETSKINDTAATTPKKRKVGRGPLGATDGLTGATPVASVGGMASAESGAGSGKDGGSAGASASGAASAESPGCPGVLS